MKKLTYSKLDTYEFDAPQKNCLSSMVANLNEIFAQAT